MSTSINRTGQGHLMRRNDDRWKNKLQDWIPLNIKRPIGRPPINWVNSLTFKNSTRDSFNLLIFLCYHVRSHHYVSFGIFNFFHWILFEVFIILSVDRHFFSAEHSLGNVALGKILLITIIKARTNKEIGLLWFSRWIFSPISSYFGKCIFIEGVTQSEVGFWLMIPFLDFYNYRRIFFK